MKDDLTRKELEALIPQLLDDQQGEIPCMSSTLRRLSALNAESDGSMQELAEIILEDYGLINRVLQIVNSSYYRRLNREVTTVTQAVILLGFDTVKSIAMDMAILDLLSPDSSRAAIQVMAKAFLTAHLAEAVEERTGGHAPEALFVASLYRPLARMVTVLQDSELYEKIISMEQHGDKTARRLARHFLRSVGYTLAEKWSIPSRLAGFMTGCKQFSSSVPARDLNLVKTASRLSSVVMEENNHEAFSEIVKKFKSDFGIEKEQLVEALQQAMSKASDKSPAFASLLKDIHIEKLVSGHEHVEQADEDVKAPGPAREDRPATRPIDRDELFLDLLNQITEAILENKLSIDQVLLLAVEVLRRGLDPVNIALCLFTPDRKNMVVRYALGKNAGIIKKHFQGSNPLERPPLNAAFQQDSEVMGTWAHLIAHQYLKECSMDANAVCASPVKIKNRTLGCFLLDFNPSREINGKLLKKIAQIRRLVVLSALQRVQGR